MNRKIYNEYVTILESELVPALGCTEPIALAYAAAKAKEVLGKMPDHITMRCSGNIIKSKRSKSTEFRRNERRRSSGGTRNYQAEILHRRLKCWSMLQIGKSTRRRNF